MDLLELFEGLIVKVFTGAVGVTAADAPEAAEVPPALVAVAVKV